jgi:hypothetical protein
MARKFTFTNEKGKVIYERITPNYIGEEEIIAGMIRDTGQDPRINTRINKSIRMVDDSELKKPEAKTRKRYRRK